MTDILPLAKIVLGLFLLWKLAKLMMGSGNESTADVFKEMLVWSIVLALASDTGGWVKQIQTMMNEVYTWAGGGIGFFDNLDIWSGKMQTLAGNLYKKDDSHFVKAAGFLAVMLIIAAMFLIVVTPLIIISLSYIAVQILIILAPFMILSFIFPSIKQLFDNWINLFLKNILIVMLISIIQSALVTNIITFLDASIKDSTTTPLGQIIMTATNVLMLSSFYTVLILASIPIAIALTGSIRSMGLGKGV
jgi:type IV secretory pathway VirB6-like protein